MLVHQPPAGSSDARVNAGPARTRATARELVHIADRLSRMVSDDEQALAHVLELPAASNRRKDLDVVRARNETALQGIVTAYGWPAVDPFGSQAAADAVKIACHCRDVDFLRTCRDLLRDAVMNGACQVVHFAFVADRYAVCAGERQIYGTQINPDTRRPYPVRDREATDDLRAAIGLEPLTAATTSRLVVARAAVPLSVLRAGAWC